MNLFVDEQKAFDKMKADGLSDEQAQELIKQRRSDLMGGNTKLNPLQSAALLQMQKSGVTSDEAVNRVIRQGEGPADDRPAWKKAGEAATNVALGNLADITKKGGNLLDFVTQGGGKDLNSLMGDNRGTFAKMADEGINALDKSTRDSAAFKAGSYLPDVAMAVAPVGGANLAKLPLAAQGAIIGGGYGAIDPILEKGSGASASDIGSWAATGAVTGGLAGATIGGVIAGANAVSKIAKNPGQSPLIRDLAGAWRSALASDAEAAASAGQKYERLFNEGVARDGTKVSIPAPEGGIGESVNSAVRKLYGIGDNVAEEKLTRIANRAVMPSSLGKTERAIMKQPEQVKDGLETLWKEVRSGNIDGSLDTFGDVAKAALDTLDHYGKIIGKAVDDNVGAAVKTDALANVASDTIKNSTKTAQRAPGFSYLETVLEDLQGGVTTMGKAQELKSEIGSQLASLKQSGNAGSKAYKALTNIYDGLQTGIDDVVDQAAGRLPELKNARDVYRRVKAVSLPLAKSFQVEMRQAPATLPETMALIQNVNPAELLANPIGGIKALGMQKLGEAIKDVNSRAGNLGNFFRILDERAVKGNWGNGTVGNVMKNAGQTSGSAATITKRTPKAKPNGEPKTTDIGE